MSGLPDLTMRNERLADVATTIAVGCIGLVPLTLLGVALYLETR